MNPEISIIIPCYNKEKYIAETIVSVINQTYLNWELIIIDDISSDNSASIIKMFSAKDNRIKCVTNLENKGANFSRNVGIQKSLGKYIVFLDADDVLSKNCLGNRYSKINNSEYNFCVFSMGTFYHKVGDSTSEWQPKSISPLSDFFMHKLPWSILQPIWNKDFLMALGGFDIQFKRLQDIELHTRALLRDGVNYKQFDEEPDCYYRIDNNRLNYSNFDFMYRWVESANLYYSKFFSEAKQLNKHHYLIGTIYQTYLQLLIRYKKGALTKSEFNILKDKLVLDLNIGKSKFIFFKISKVFNLLPIRIPGINFMINKILTSS